MCLNMVGVLNTIDPLQKALEVRILKIIDVNVSSRLYHGNITVSLKKSEHLKSILTLWKYFGVN